MFTAQEQKQNKAETKNAIMMIMMIVKYVWI